MSRCKQCGSFAINRVTDQLADHGLARKRSDGRLPSKPITKETEMKYDAVIGYWQTRILQGVSREMLDAYCASKGLRIDTDRAIGVFYREVLLVKA